MENDLPATMYVLIPELPECIFVTYYNKISLRFAFYFPFLLLPIFPRLFISSCLDNYNSIQFYFSTLSPFLFGTLADAGPSTWNTPFPPTPPLCLYPCLSWLIPTFQFQNKGHYLLEAFSDPISQTPPQNMASTINTSDSYLCYALGLPVVEQGVYLFTSEFSVLSRVLGVSFELNKYLFNE